MFRYMFLALVVIAATQASAKVELRLLNEYKCYVSLETGVNQVIDVQVKQKSRHQAELAAYQRGYAAPQQQQATSVEQVIQCVEFKQQFGSAEARALDAKKLR
ncbi:TapY2 family type IVa secretion system protein [Pseudoalteromonas sp. SW0106-04]|uniref:TapY2 family type IVa secretion system protein n=1 Tax=Pseudoalteromonas sp. SW0106-04 TaxID=1702169 RepID=UPI0006B5E41F|nr:TapY2 family type IVa secretion system protein [Pseudoalteromonas sp. SW0106-04]